MVQCLAPLSAQILAALSLFSIAHPVQFRRPPGAAILLDPIVDGGIGAATYIMQFANSGEGVVFGAIAVPVAVFSAHHPVCARTRKGCEERGRRRDWVGGECVWRGGGAEFSWIG